MFVSLTCSFFTDEAVGSGSTWIGPKARHLRLLQVGTETRVTGLARQPAQAAVGEGGHVLPTPVWHVDFPQAHPGRQPLWRYSKRLNKGLKSHSVFKCKIKFHNRSAPSCYLRNELLLHLHLGTKNAIKSLLKIISQVWLLICLQDSAFHVMGKWWEMACQGSVWNKQASFNPADWQQMISSWTQQGMTKLKSSVDSTIFFQRTEDMWLWGDEKVSVCPKAQFIISIKDEEAWIMTVMGPWTNHD